MKEKLYSTIARLIEARNQYSKTKNMNWCDRHRNAVDELVKNYMPSGSGVDSGTKLDWDRSGPNKLVFRFGYHHMNETGMYDGWTEHTLLVTPTLTHGFDMIITGKDRNQIKEYLYDLYHLALSKEVVF